MIMSERREAETPLRDASLAPSISSSHWIIQHLLLTPRNKTFSQSAGGALTPRVRPHHKSVQPEELLWLTGDYMEWDRFNLSAAGHEELWMMSTSGSHMLPPYSMPAPLHELQNYKKKKKKKNYRTVAALRVCSNLCLAATQQHCLKVLPPLIFLPHNKIHHSIFVNDSHFKKRVAGKQMCKLLCW